MSSGFNTDVRLGEQVFHIQTEDYGPGRSMIDTAVYQNGRVLYRRLSDYGDFALSSAFSESSLREKVEQQHRAVIEDQINAAGLQVIEHQLVEDPHIQTGEIVQVMVVLRSPHQIDRHRHAELTEGLYHHTHIGVVGISGYRPDARGKIGRVRRRVNRGCRHQRIHVSSAADGLAEDARKVAAAGQQFGDPVAWADAGAADHALRAGPGRAARGVAERR